MMNSKNKIVVSKKEARLMRTQMRTNLVHSTLLLLKLDAKNLLTRIVTRKEEYLMEFSLKRTREHFKEIFFNRYQDCSIQDLKWCGQEVISSLDSFYSKVDELWWYLNHTQDMIKTAEDKVSVQIKVLERLYATLELYINAETEVKEEENNNQQDTSESEKDTSDNNYEADLGYDSDANPEDNELAAITEYNNSESLDNSFTNSSEKDVVFETTNKK